MYMPYLSLYILYIIATYAAQGTNIDDTKQHTKQASLEAIYTNIKDQCQDLLIGMRRLTLQQVTALVTTSTTDTQTSVIPINVSEGHNYGPLSDIIISPTPPSALLPLAVHNDQEAVDDTEGEGGGFQLSLEGIEGMVEVTESDMLDVSAMLLDDDDDQAPPLPLPTSTSLHLQQARQDQQQQVVEESAALRRVGIHVLHSAAKRAAMSKQNAAHVFPGYSTEHPCATHPSHIQALQAAHATPGFANPLQLIAKIAVTKTSPFASTTAPSPQMYSNNSNNSNNMNASSSPYALPYATSSTGILDPGIAYLPPPLSSLRPNLSMNSMGGAAEDTILAYSHPHHQQQQQQSMYHTAPPPQSMAGSNITQRLQQQHQQQPNISLPGVPTMSHTQPMLYSGYPTNTGQGLKQSQPALPQHTVGTAHGTGQPGSTKGAAPPLYNIPPHQQQQGKSMQWDGSNNNNMLLQRTQQVRSTYSYSS